MTEQRDDLDDTLDAALATYSGRCERIGLLTRILAQLEETRKRSLSLVYAGAAVSICAFFCCMILTHQPEVRVAVHQQRPAAASKVTTTTIQPGAVASTLRHPRRRRRIEAKLAQFPEPAPMTNEERALLRVVTAQPAHIPAELKELGAPIEPIEIAAVEVRRLE
jgi:hypothetical protein